MDSQYENKQNYSRGVDNRIPAKSSDAPPQSQWRAPHAHSMQAPPASYQRGFAPPSSNLDGRLDGTSGRWVHTTDVQDPRFSSQSAFLPPSSSYDRGATSRGIPANAQPPPTTSYHSQSSFVPPSSNHGGRFNGTSVRWAPHPSHSNFAPPSSSRDGSAAPVTNVQSPPLYPPQSRFSPPNSAQEGGGQFENSRDRRLPLNSYPSQSGFAPTTGVQVGGGQFQNGRDRGLPPTNVQVAPTSVSYPFESGCAPPNGDQEGGQFEYGRDRRVPAQVPPTGSAQTAKPGLERRDRRALVGSGHPPSTSTDENIQYPGATVGKRTDLSGPHPDDRRAASSFDLGPPSDILSVQQVSNGDNFSPPSPDK